MMSRLVDSLADFLAANPAALTLIGIVLIIANLILQAFPGLGWIRESNLLLHVGLVLGLFGILASRAL